MDKKSNEKSQNNRKKNNENLIHLDMNDVVAQGSYSNLALSNVNQEEFILDFIFLQPNINKGQVISRIIMTPKNVKRLVKMLNNQLREYDSIIGTHFELSQFSYHMAGCC